MWLEALRMLLTSFVGSLGFAIILQAPRRSLLTSAFIGSLGYLCYWGIVRTGGSEWLAMFCGALVGSLLAQVAARREHRVATIFVTIAIIPLVPGLGLYRSMQFLAQGMSSQGARLGVQTMMSFLMLALGVTVGSFVCRAVFRRREG